MADLSPHGRALLKSLGGDMGQVRATPAAVRRWGLDQPDSIASVLPPDFLTRVLVLPDEALNMPEQKLAELGQVSRQDRRVRIQFWHEYERAFKERRLMDLGQVVEHTGVPSWEGYEEKLHLSPLLFAWLMQPPPGYRLQMEEAMELGLKRLTDIMELPIQERDAEGKLIGKPNVGVALLILQAIKLVDQRVNGAITQKMVNVNLHGAEPPPAAKIDMDAVEKRIKELEAQLGSGGTHENGDSVLRRTTDRVETEIVDVDSTVEPPPGDAVDHDTERK